ncbi:MAG: hypothetical protein LBH28_01995 [Oscillospiraceae bacterium]|nr:hypothetical protein [Oscillospiraceae bacterium]
MKRRRFSMVLGCALTLAILVSFAIPFVGSAATVTIDFVNPKAKLEPADNFPLANRLESLEGKKVLSLYYGKQINAEATRALGELLEEKYGAIHEVANGGILAYDGAGPNYWLNTGRAPVLGVPWGPKTGMAFTDGRTFNEDEWARYEKWASYDAVILGVAD